MRLVNFHLILVFPSIAQVRVSKSYSFIVASRFFNFWGTTSGLVSQGSLISLDTSVWRPPAERLRTNYMEMGVKVVIIATVMGALTVFTYLE